MKKADKETYLAYRIKKVLEYVLSYLMKNRRNQYIEKVNGLEAEINSYLMWIR